MIFVGCSQEIDVDKAMPSSRESLSLKKEAKEGRHIFKDGSIYEGQLVMGEPDGYGKHELANGDIYEGQYKSGLAHGHGTMKYKSDDKLDQYVGSWKSGKRNGFGTLVILDGSTLVGDWKNDSMNVGDFKSPKGVVMSGKWEGEYLSEGTMATFKIMNFQGMVF